MSYNSKVNWPTAMTAVRLIPHPYISSLGTSRTSRASSLSVFLTF
jgi:hypothetical protein